MQGAFKIQNEPLAMKVVTPTELIATLVNTGDIEQVYNNPNLFFQKLWIYPASAYTAATGQLILNANAIYIGKSGLASPGHRAFTPDKLLPTDLPIKYELPLGQKMAISQIIFSGTAGDGVVISWW